MAKINKRISIFLYFLLTYLVVLLVPFFASVPLYTYFAQKFEDNLKAHNLSIINTSVEAVDVVFDEIQNTTAIIQNSKNLSDFMKIESFQGPNQNMVKLLSLMKELNSLKNLNSDMIDIFLYARQSDAIVTTKSLFMDSTSFYQPDFFTIQGLSHSEMMDMLFAGGHKGVLLPFYSTSINNVPYNGYFYCKEVPNGMIVLCLNDTIFSRTLKELNISDKGLVLVTDGTGRSYYRYGADTDFPLVNVDDAPMTMQEFVQDGVPFLSIWAQSQKTGLIYTAYTPKDVILQQANVIRRTTVLVFVFSAGIAVLLALFLSKSNAKPIQEVLSLFSSRPERYSYQSTFSYLKGNIGSMIHSNAQIERKLQEQMPLVKSAMIQNLLQGEYESDKKLEQSLALSEIQLQADWHSVIIVKITEQSPDSYESLLLEKKLKMIITDLFMDTGKNRFTSIYDYNMNGAKIAFLMSFNSDKPLSPEGYVLRDANHAQEMLEHFAQEVYHSILSRTGTAVAFAIGEPFAEIKNISISYDQAKQAVASMTNYPDKIIYYYNDMMEKTCDFYYPFDMEQRLSNFIKAGNCERTEQLLRLVYLENFVKRKIGTMVKQHLFHTLYTTLLRTAGEQSVSIEPGIFLMNEDADFDDSFDRIIQAFLSVCNFYQAQTEEETDNYQMQIVQFIKTNFSDPNLTLTLLAEQFSISERVLYHELKLCLNDTFTSYLEQLRINHAKELLLQESWSVEKIATQVGYTNLRSFQRAFKRVVDCTPNEYRSKG